MAASFVRCICNDRVTGGGRFDCCHSLVKRVIENVEHHDSENGNRDEAGGAGDCVVNARRDAGMVFSD